MTLFDRISAFTKIGINKNFATDYLHIFTDVKLVSEKLCKKTACSAAFLSYSISEYQYSIQYSGRFILSSPPPQQSMTSSAATFCHI